MTTINDILANQSDIERTKTLTAYLGAVAKLHQSGQHASININQNKSHNTLLNIVSVNSTGNHADNFADCLSQLYPRYDRYLQTVFHSYNDTAPQKASSKYIERLVYKRRKMFEKSLESCFATNDRFNVKKNWGSFQVINRKHDSSSLQKLLNKPDQAIEQGKILKDCTATTVTLYTMTNGKKVIIKRHNSKGTFYSLTRSLIDSRARVCWKGALLLKQMGINTPENLAMIECKAGPWIKTSYLITEFIQGTTLSDFFCPENQPHWPTVTQQVKDILYSFPSIRVAHGDFKATNFIVANSQVFIIDLDSMASHVFRSLFNGTYQRDIDRFEHNWVHTPTAAQLFAPIVQSIRNLQ